MRLSILQELKAKLFKFPHRKFKVLITMAFCFSVGLCALDRAFPPKLSNVRDHSIALLDNEKILLGTLLATDERWRFPVKLSEVDPLYLKMLLAFEDKRFYYHFGVDPLSLLRASVQWLLSARVISGGSSLSMQTVRLLEPRPRTLKTKLKEILRAIQLECHFSKQEILEMYLTKAPFGGNLEGIRAATLAYFGKEPRQLTIAEAALLVALPQAPNRLRPDLSPKIAKMYRDKVLNRMQKKGILNPQQVSEAMEDRLPACRYAFPKHASHVTAMLAKEKNTSKIKQTTLNGQLQKQIEKLAKAEARFLPEHQSIAVLIVENKTRQVQVLLGSADFFDQARKGQVNMIKAYRSPGSLLKPFIYALAFEENLIHPETIIQDIPTGFSGYHPSNFKDVFHGAVTLREALKQSLNIPAVALLDKLGPKRFHAFLSSFAVILKFEHAHVDPSLPIALGGVGMTLWDLVSLYTALANQGEFKPLLISPPFVDSMPLAQKITTAKAALQITDILEETPAPEGFVDRSVILKNAIAYKTGTSYGYRDAWAIGYNQDYTVGIWVGRADGTSSAPHTGRTTAAPLLFKVFDVLPNTRAPGQRQNQKQSQLAAQQEVPSHLQEFRVRGQKSGEKQAIKIQFPKEGAIIGLQSENTHWHPVSISISAGVPPYFLLVDGKPTAVKNQGSKIIWQPKSIGFVELTLLDSEGGSDSVSVELQGSVGY